MNNGDNNVHTVAGVFYKAEDPRYKSIRLPVEITQSNQTGESSESKQQLRKQPQKKN